MDLETTDIQTYIKSLLIINDTTSQYYDTFIENNSDMHLVFKEKTKSNGKIIIDNGNDGGSSNSPPPSVLLV